ncbi:hypothetical protein K443DRAFT_683816 [Laccaria amethystina LaAM-08-1]|uniref:Uncharacterized protein n=1 Tax=Laccaria amethystina LaAM-08-1 TaxID=1095629 RepID=A0A0C9WZG2_9AGAR|nr:hypothetical protein K443DRAFT_683816 [Laccaria amethystina LaAM-08-1]
MDAVVTKHRTIDLRAEKIVLVVNWMGMDTNSRANVKGGEVTSASSSVTCRTAY